MSSPIPPPGGPQPVRPQVAWEPHGAPLRIDRRRAAAIRQAGPAAAVDGAA